MMLIVKDAHDAQQYWMMIIVKDAHDAQQYWKMRVIKDAHCRVRASCTRIEGCSAVLEDAHCARCS